MNLNQIQSIIAPFAAPAAPAVLIGSQLYHGMTAANVPPAVALIGSVASGVGMEMAGALAFSMALVALRRKAYGPMWVAIVCVVFYALFAAAGIATAANGLTFVMLVGMSLVAFGGAGTMQYLSDMTAGDTSRAQVLDAETRNINAQARLAKAAARVDTLDTPHVSTDTPDSIQVSALGSRIQEYISTHPDESDRAVADACETTHRTVGVWRRRMAARS